MPVTTCRMLAGVVGPVTTVRVVGPTIAVCVVEPVCVTLMAMPAMLIVADRELVPVFAGTV